MSDVAHGSLVHSTYSVEWNLKVKTSKTKDVVYRKGGKYIEPKNGLTTLRF